MNGHYLILASRIEAELARIAPLVQRTLNAWRKAEETEDDLFVDAVAINLHSFYSGVERILESVADSIDESKPAGESWHRDLLEQMTLTVPGVRPAVLSQTTAEMLDKYRGFRHVVRNVYTYQFDPLKIKHLVSSLPSPFQMMASELTIFASFLAQAGRES